MVWFLTGSPSPLCVDGEYSCMKGEGELGYEIIYHVHYSVRTLTEIQKLPR